VDGVKVVASQFIDSYAAIMEHPDLIDYAFTGFVGGVAVLGTAAAGQAAYENIVERRHKE
jgi:hypothetical protein